MKELIYITTVVGERLEKVMDIVGNTLVKVTQDSSEALVEILVTSDEWTNIKAMLAATR